MFGLVIHIVLDIIKKVTWIYRFAFSLIICFHSKKLFELLILLVSFISLSLIFGTSIHVVEILTIMQIRYFHTWLLLRLVQKTDKNNENDVAFKFIKKLNWFARLSKLWLQTISTQTRSLFMTLSWQSLKWKLNNTII